jgi:two-component system response regulator YesN
MWPDELINAKAFDYYPTLNKIRRYFEKNYTQSISLEDAAKIVGLEAKHFGKFFQHKVGIGFKKWTTMFRVRMAIEAIRKEHQPLTDIAFAVGFRDFRTFERAFKKETGVTPREFRRTVMP